MSNEHSGNCASGEGHRTIVLVLTVPEEHHETTMAILGTVRTGLVTDYLAGEPMRSCTYFGHFTVEGADRDLAYALGGECEGQYEATPDEPAWIREHALMAGVRALVQAAS